MSVEDVLRVARGGIGYNGTGTEDSPSSVYGAWYGINPGQWCAMYVSYCLAKGGHPQHIETAKGFAYCPSGVHYFSDKGAYATRKAFKHVPKPGDVVFFDFGMGRASHVGLVESYDPATGLITSIQGNTTDARIGRTGNCCRRKVHNDHYVVGYGRPDYGAATAAAAVTPQEEPDVLTEEQQQWMHDINYNADQARHKVEYLINVVSEMRTDQAAQADAAKAAAAAQAIAAAAAAQKTLAQLTAAIAEGVSKLLAAAPHPPAGPVLPPAPTTPKAGAA